MFTSWWPEEVSILAKIYADLIRKGRKTLEQVPANLRAEVEALLKAEADHA